MKLKPQAPDLMCGIPRGLSTKYLKDQSIPQSRWQTQEAILAHPVLAYDPAKPEGKILLGAIGDQLIGVADDRHMQTFAGTRAGKSVTVIANLQHYDGSIFMLDSKAEGANKTARRRAELGQNVFVLDPFDRTRGPARKFRAKYNPLSPLALESETIIEDAMLIVDGMIVSSGQEKDPHWNESAGAALLGFILYVALGSNVPDDKRHMGTVRECVRLAKRTYEREDGKRDYELPKRIGQGIVHLYEAGQVDVADAIKGAVYGLYEKAPDEMASVLSTMNRHTAFLDFLSMKKVMSGHDFDLRDLKRKKATVYLCLPAIRMGTCNRWLRILINQLIAAMEMEEAVPEAPVLAVLDEFPVLGHMKQIEDAAGQMAGFHLKLWTILQDWSQGKALYGERWESFAANSGVSQFFANVDLATTEYISKRMGKTPVLSTRQGDTSHDQREKGLGGSSQSKQLFDMMAPDEIARTFARSDPLKRQLIQMAGLHPMILQRVEYWNEAMPYHQVFAGKYDTL